MRPTKLAIEALMTVMAVVAVCRNLAGGSAETAPSPAPPAARPRLAGLRGEQVTLEARAQGRPVRLRAGRLGLARERLGPLLRGPARGLRLDEVYVVFDVGAEGFELLAGRAVLEGQGSVAFEDCHLRFAGTPEIIAAERVFWSEAGGLEIPGEYRVFQPPDARSYPGRGLTIPLPLAGWRPPAVR